MRVSSFTIFVATSALLPVAAGASVPRTAEQIRAEMARLEQLLQLERQALADFEGGSAEANSTENTPPADVEPSEQVAQAPDSSDIKTVTVNAERERNTLRSKQDVPSSISVVNAESLEALGADSLREITRRAANISRANTSNARNQALVVRGIGRRGTTEAQDPTVGVNVDGVPYAYTGLAAWDFVDIDTVEVARGPQGTAGGHNPSFGLLSLTTKRPTFTSSTDYSLRAGQRDSIFATAAHGGPIIDDVLAWRGTFYVNKGLGAFTNDYWNGNQTYTDRLKISGKVQLLFAPERPDGTKSPYTAHLSLDLQPKTFENDNGLNFFHATPGAYSNGTPVNMSTDAKTRLARRWFDQLDNYSYDNNYLNYQSGRQNNDSQLPLVTGTRGVGLTQTFDFGRSTLTSITAFRDLDFEARNDEGTPFDISTQGGGGVRYQQLTQELRLASRIGSLADYTTGLFFIHHEYEVESKTGWGDDAGAWFANAGQYSLLDADGDGRYLLTQSLSGLRKLGVASVDNKSLAAFGNVDWHLTDKVSIGTGLRASREDRTGEAVASVEQQGYGAQLNASISSFGVPMGGFDSYYNSASSAVWVRDGLALSASADKAGATLVAAGSTGLTTSSASVARLSSSQAAADAAATKYFRAASWAALNNRQKQQLAYAQAIRKSQLAQIYDPIDAEPFRKTQLTYNFSPRYRFTDDLTGYLSYQHGEKPSIAQVVNGNSLLADGETGNHHEIGIKTSLFSNTLQLNADVFLSRLKNYQQSSAVVDQFTTTFNDDGQTYYTTVAANVPRIQVHGLEVDGAWTAIPFTTVDFSAAYNVARYKDFPSAPQTPENGFTGSPAFQDLSGRILPGAAKVTANVAAELRYPWLEVYDFHTNVNVNYTSRYNSDITLSSYSWIEPYTVVDFGIGVGRRDRAFDVTLLAKNLTNAEGKAYNWLNGTLDTTPRWIGFIVSGHF